MQCSIKSRQQVDITGPSPHRSKQCVVVESDSGEGGRVYYDQLVLCTGTQFHPPGKEEEEEEEEEEEDEESSHIFAINYEPQATAMLDWVKTKLIPEGGEGGVA